MKLFINKHYFLSVIKNEELYSCQLMGLIHGMGMTKAFFDDKHQEDIVSSIVYLGVIQCSKTVKSLDKVCDFHKYLLEALTK